jgi:HK97 family phage prohead protease
VIRLTAPIQVAAEAADDTAGDADSLPSRTITGLAVVYGVVAEASTGPVMFLEGSLPTDGPAPKLLLNHDMHQLVGVVTERQQVDGGVQFRARISATARGDEALQLVLDGALDSVSVGVDLLEAEQIDGVTVVAQADWLELSITPMPAFRQARITDVAANQAADPETPTETQSQEDTEMHENTDAVVTTPALSFTRSRGRTVTAGRYITELLAGGLSPDVQAIVAQDASGDVPGIVPELLVGTVFDTLTEDRPVVSALGTNGMPAGGETFYRRKVTGHTTVSQQAAEFDELGSTKYEVDKVNVSKVWFGGTLEVSEQAMAYSDQSLMDLIIRDMAREYAAATELYTCTELIGGASTATATVADWTDGDEVIEDLYLAAAEIKANSKLMPTHLIVSTGVWAKIGAAKDSAGNRIFPYLGPSNAAGTLNGTTSLTGNPLGLQLIVSDDIVVNPATDAAVILNSRALELYEDRRGAIQALAPSTLSTTLAFRGVFAVADLALADAALSLV